MLCSTIEMRRVEVLTGFEEAHRRGLGGADARLLVPLPLRRCLCWAWTPPVQGLLQEPTGLFRGWSRKGKGCFLGRMLARNSALAGLQRGQSTHPLG